MSEKESTVNDHDSSSTITYYRYSGEVNTDHLLRAAKERSLERGIKTIVVASETGKSALMALDILRNTGIRMVVVTHYPSGTFGPHGEIPIGINRIEYGPAKDRLEKSGIEIVQGTRPFVPPSRIDWTWNNMEGIIDSTLELFGSGTKIAVEVAIMATDAGKVEPGEEIISCGGTFKGLDTALIVRTAFSHRFFQEFEIREIIAKPRFLVHQEGQYMDQNWRGNLNTYYDNLKKSD